MLSREIILYIEIDMLCFVLMCIMLRNVWHTHKLAHDDFYFFICTGAMQTILIADVANCVLEGLEYSWVTIPLYVINAIYFIGTGIAALSWLAYTDFAVSLNPSQASNRRIMFNIPCAFLTVMCICSLKTGWIFYIDEFNRYHRGDFHIVQQLICMLYFLCALVYSVVAYFSSSIATHKELCKKLMYYNIYPIIGAVLQISFPELVLAWPVCSVGMIIVFVQIQNSQIALDSLTGLNNRRRLFKYINEKIDKISKDDVMTCLMLELDDFASINHRYGHLVGDDLLKRVADIVKNSSSKIPGSHFLARYSSSVFAIVSIDSTMENTYLLKDLIVEKINEYNNNTTNSYRLELNTSVVEYDLYNMTPDDFFTLGDELLTEESNEKHLLRKDNIKSEDLIK